VAFSEALRRLAGLARERVRARVAAGDQIAGHGLAHLATDVEACVRLREWAIRVGGEGPARLADVFEKELAHSLPAGVATGACDAASLDDLGLSPADLPESPPPRGADYLEIARAPACDPGLGDADLERMRTELARFSDREVRPIAQEIHRKDALVPMDLVRRMAGLGVFGITVPEAQGGLGLGRVAMCVVTEELARGSLGVGSIATRSEIAAELVRLGGTDAQRRHWLPRIAAGDALPAAVFSEPDHGTDLASVQTRAVRRSDGSWVVTGHKTWATHAARADVMTLLVRTGGEGHSGLSMLLAPKTRRDDGFVDPGLRGTEIPVLGYRGMREYEISFDGFRVPPDGLLGDREGAGFAQLMATFETARIQTAARGVGVARAALDEATGYAGERRQFGRPIAEHPRIARKLGRMKVLVQAARQLTLHAARRKDAGVRADLEAGMAKLFATRVAWECADACVQIHGGNGYAEEFTASRLLVDARVLSIFEGTSEIQAEVVARRLLEE
jgi:(2S)-methylsuccinyl-CoA dehydrogenase